MNEQPAKLNLAAWYIDQINKSQQMMHHMEQVLGTFKAERSIMYHFMDGYVQGLEMLYRKMEEEAK